MHRRSIIAAALGVPAAAALPNYAYAATTTPDADHTQDATFVQAQSDLREELDRLAVHYATRPGMTNHGDTCASSLWLYGQTHRLLDRAPLHSTRDISRLAAEAAFFTAGCYLDFGEMQAALDLYSQAHRLAEHHHDTRVFVSAQANWVPMYQGQWATVLRRTDNLLPLAEQQGGPGLLMTLVHRAHALAHFGRREEARNTLADAQDAIRRVPGAHNPHTGLHYSAAKVHFSSASAYAVLGDREHHAQAAAAASEDPSLGWMDQQILGVAGASLEPETEHAAHRVRMELVRIDGGLSNCVKEAAVDACARLKAKQVLSGNGQAGPEVKTLASYLHTAKTATAA